MEPHVKTTAEMMDEVQCESVQNLLTSVLYETAPLGMTGFPDLDAHIFSSLSYHPSTNSSLNRGDVIEIQGSASSGKTHFLYHMTMNCILPKEVVFTPINDPSQVSHVIHIGGWNKAAIIIDTDGRWSIPRLHCLLSGRLARILPHNHHTLRPSIQELVIKSLEKIHVFRPTSSSSLAATLMYLPAYHTNYMAQSEIALLMIDSISAFYWPDRLSVENRRMDKDDSSSALNHILTNLQSFRLSHGPVTLLTNWGLQSISKTTDATAEICNPGQQPFFRQHLHPYPAPFEHPPRNLTNASRFPPITHHITLSLAYVAPLNPEFTSMAYIKKAEAERSEIIQQGEVRGVVRTVESGRSAKFAFEIHDDGINA